jgi:hypothetical protein
MKKMLYRGSSMPSKPVTTEQKAIDAFAKYGAVIVSSYRGAKHKVTFRCKCGALSEIKPDLVIQGKQRPFCVAHHYDTITGENHYLYVPDKAPLLEMRRALEGRDGFYQRVKEFHNFTCAISGLTSHETEVASHHLDGAAANLDRAHDVHNGICITRELHKEFHLIYGHGRPDPNTAEQFAEFYWGQTGHSFSDFYDLQSRTYRHV